MPRPSIKLEPYKAELIEKFQNNTSLPALEEYLSNEYGIEVN